MCHAIVMCVDAAIRVKRCLKTCNVHSSHTIITRHTKPDVYNEHTNPNEPSSLQTQILPARVKFKQKMKQFQTFLLPDSFCAFDGDCKVAAGTGFIGSPFEKYTFKWANDLMKYISPVPSSTLAQCLWFGRSFSGWGRGRSLKTSTWTRGSSAQPGKLMRNFM